MSIQQVQRRVIMARTVAAQWLEQSARPEYHLTILIPGGDTRNLPSILDGFRAGRLRVAGMKAPANFGVLAEFDSVSVWSSDGEALQKLAEWCEARGYETTGVV